MIEDAVVHVVDDDDALRESLLALLRANKIRCEGYPSAEDFLDRAVWDHPGCVVVDLRMNGMGGEALIRLLARDGDPPPTIVLTGHGTIENAVSTVRDGAIDFLQKPAPNDRMLEAIERGVTLDVERFKRRRAMAELRQRIATLTPRERGILDEMLTGKTSPEIARVLGLQPKSVQVYRSRVLQKMAFATTVEMVRHLLLASAQEWAAPGRAGQSG